VTDTEIDALRRELLIAARAAHKLSVALNLAWAGLTQVRGFATHRRHGKAVTPVPNKDQTGVDRPLPFPEDPFA